MKTVAQRSAVPTMKDYLDWLKLKPRTLGWDSVIAYPLSVANHSLWHEYVEKFDKHPLASRISGVIELVDNSRWEYIYDEVGGGKVRSAEAVVMLIRAPTVLPIKPPFVGAIHGQGEVSFEVPEEAVRGLLGNAGSMPEEDVMWRWSVVGDGTVVGDGRTARFTPSAVRSESTLSVLVCEMVGPGVDHLCGFAVVEQTAVSVMEDPHWEKLSRFEVEVAGSNQVFANGMQQILVRMVIETSSIEVDGEQVLIPVSPIELATLKLVNRRTNTEVPFIDPNQEGIEYESNVMWATSLGRNRFNSFKNSMAGAEVGESRSDGGISYADLYLHLKDTDEPLELYAQFVSKDGRVMRSLDYGNDPTQSIHVQGVMPPSVGLADYEFERKRVWSSGGQPDGDDDFSYIPRSIDFWTLAYRKGGFDTAGFATLKVESNTSTIQWESELLDELYYSQTTYAFSPKHRLQVAPPTEMSFDPYLAALMHEIQHAPPNVELHSNPPSPGELLVGLQRLDDVTYWYDGQAHDNKAKMFRKMLDKPVRYTLLDENGNRHYVQIGFQDPSLNGSRNLLNLIIL